MDGILLIKSIITITQLALLYAQIKYKKPELCAVIAILCLLNININ